MVSATTCCGPNVFPPALETWVYTRLGFAELGPHVGSPGKCASTTYTKEPAGSAVISGSQSSPPQKPRRVAPARALAPRLGRCTTEGRAVDVLTFGGRPIAEPVRAEPAGPVNATSARTNPRTSRLAMVDVERERMGP